MKHVVELDFQALLSLIGRRRESLQRIADFQSNLHFGHDATKVAQTVVHDHTGLKLLVGKRHSVTWLESRLSVLLTQANRRQRFPRPVVVFEMFPQKV